MGHRPAADADQRVLTGPPDQVRWIDLHTLARTDPDRAAARWEEVKRAALDELRIAFAFATARSIACS